MKKIEKYEKTVNNIVKEFCKKQNCDFDYWVGDMIGEVGQFGDNFFNFTDVYIDLKKDAPVGLIFEWQNNDIEFNIDRKEHININYRSYIMGARFEKDTKKAKFDWLYKKCYIDDDGIDITKIKNICIDGTNKKNIELRFAFDNDKYNIIHNPTKKDVKRAIHLFGTSVISKL